MTRISGHTSITSPCCKSLYKVVEYASMNFNAYAYWTDGAKDGGLMPNDGGLRVCRCGIAFLLRDAIRLEIGTTCCIALICCVTICAMKYCTNVLLK